MRSMSIPYAIADYADLRTRGFYYVDKTQFIASLEDYSAPVFLRPRRFGKSLLCSTLAYYYDLRQKDRFEQLFGNTWIGAHPTEEHNQYLVLRFDFSKMVLADTAEGLEKNFNDLNCNPIRSLVRDKAFYPDLFPNFSFTEERNASKMLEDVLSYVAGNRLPPLYIIIDEYDNFTNQLLTAYKDPLYDNITTKDSFLRTFFKVIKAGLGEQTVRTCFCTGVLPITMDDLTSGYNVAEILTLRPNFLNMLGFTYAEAEAYLKYVINKYGKPGEAYEEIWQLIVNNYDGYRFQPDAEPLFNSTILTYFFKYFATEGGNIPEEMIDENLRTDINWIRRLTLNLENAREMLDTLVVDDELSYSLPDLRSKFNRNQFFDKKFYPISLFYLGMTTLKSRFKMCLPNLTMRSIYMDYYNQLNNISGDVQRYSSVYEQFTIDRELEPLIRNYFEQYLGQFPAQAFDKVNENFIRCSFYELCSRYLSFAYTFALEQNHPTGRSDFEMTGIPGTAYYQDDRIVEFKYFKNSEAKKMLPLAEPRPDDVAQVMSYADTIQKRFPNFHVRKYIAYIVGNKGYKFWEV